MEYMEETILYNSSVPEVFYAIDDQYTQAWYRVYPHAFLSEDREERIYKEFIELKKKWINNTKFLSNPRLIYNDSNYRRIIEMGVSVVPYLIKDLKNRDIDWLFALKEILKIDPIAPEHLGSFGLMKNDWLNWATINVDNKYGYNDFRYAYQPGSVVSRII